jgi:hypothetical protein
MRGFATKQHQLENPVSPSVGRANIRSRGLQHRQSDSVELNSAATTTAFSRFEYNFPRISVDARTAGTLRTKLLINTPGDEYEREAEQVSQRVMRMPESKRERSCSCGGTCAECQAKHSPHESNRLQTKQVGSINLGQFEVPPIVHDVLRSPGEPLDPASRRFMEPRFGHDFSKLRVHTDQRAGESAKAVGAAAYTVGNDLVFGAGRYDPSSAGKALLAHELTHVVQQSGPGQTTEMKDTTHPGILKRTRGPALQGFWVTREAAGGCGLCYAQLAPQKPAAAAGSAAHRVIQNAFLDMLSPLYRMVEFPYTSPTDDSGRLDLAFATPKGFKIGEIKPANPTGEEQGVKDLDWYKTTLQAAYPGSTIEMMDVRAPGSGLPMPDPIANVCGCQLQYIGVTAMRPGLYGYWCNPPFSVARRQCSCRPGSPARKTSQVTNAMEAMETALDAAAVAARLVGDATVAARIEVLAVGIRAADDAAEITAIAEEAVTLLKGVEEAEDDVGIIEWIAAGLRTVEAVE